MATEVQSYPSIPASSWWGLRRRLQSAPTAKVSEGFIGTALGVSDSRARILRSSLERLGLVDSEGALTPLGHEWRDDSTYATACEKVAHLVYPAELRDALPGPDPDRTATQNWFAKTAKVGTDAARQMAQLYRLIVTADPSSQSTPPTTSKSPSAQKPAPSFKSNVSRKPSSANEESDASPPERRPALEPALSVAVQVYIPPEASLEQIDQIFSSMAKHLRQPA